MDVLITEYYGHANHVFCVAWSPDGKWVVSGDHNAVAQVWEAESGKGQAAFHGHALQVMHATWSPDGKQIASTGFDDEVVFVWQSMTGELEHTYDQPISDDANVAWSPDGQWLAACGDQSAHVWRTSDQRCVVQYRGGRFAPTVVAWSPDGRRLALGSAKGTLYVRDVATGLLVWRAAAHTAVTDIAYSPDGHLLASSGYDTTVQVRESDTGKLVQVYRGHLSGTDPATRAEFKRGPSHCSTIVRSIAWSPDSCYLASVSGNICHPFMDNFSSASDTIHIWEARTGRHVYAYTGHTNEVRAVAWSPDGRFLASASFDQTVHVWHAPV